MHHLNLNDNFNRTLDYLRLSVTDRCNLRCSYCMPEQGINFLPREQILSYEEMDRIITVLSHMGLKKLRFTGGEPFVRKGFDNFLASILDRDRNYSVHLTTNATIFPDFGKLSAGILRKISSINISIDSLDAENFERITKRNMFDKVWGNLMSYYSLGIPIKINCVVQPGLNFEEIPEFVNLTKLYNIQMRFIEPMPFNGSHIEEWNYVSAEEIQNLIKSQFDITPLPQDEENTAWVYAIKGHQGTIGIIPAYSRTICSTCNRLRINASGEVRTCLYANKGISIKNLLTEQISNRELMQFFSDISSQKKKNGFEVEQSQEQYLSMTKLGG